MDSFEFSLDVLVGHYEVCNKKKKIDWENYEEKREFLLLYLLSCLIKLIKLYYQTKSSTY